MSATLRAAAVLWPRAQAGGPWRGVIDTVEQKVGYLGPYTSARRVARCEHKHRTEQAAMQCSERKLRRIGADRAGDA